MSELENLMSFQEHMDGVKENYSEIFRIDEERRKIKGKAFSLWPGLLWLIRKLAFTLALIGFVNFAAVAIYKVPYESYVSSELSAILYNITNPIFKYGFIIYIFTYLFFLAVGRHDEKKRGFYISEFNKLNMEYKKNVNVISKKYKEYQNPPVKLNESAPSYIKALIELVNEETDIKTAKKIIKTKEKKIWNF